MLTVHVFIMFNTTIWHSWHVSDTAFNVYSTITEVADSAIPSFECTTEPCGVKTWRYAEKFQPCVVLLSPPLQSNVMLFPLVDPLRTNNNLQVTILVEFGKTEIGDRGGHKTGSFPLIHQSDYRESTNRLTLSVK